MKIKVLKDIKGYKIGQTVELSDELSKRYISRGRAEVVNERVGEVVLPVKRVAKKKKADIQ